MGLQPVVLPPGLEVDETMRGWFALGVEDFQAGLEHGRASGSALDLFLTLTYDDLDALLEEPSTPARITGALQAPALSNSPLTVNEGTFKLFVQDPDRVQMWHMTYELTMTAEDGAVYKLQGTKYIHNDGGFDGWADTTTLYARVLDQHSTPIGAGIVHISLGDLLSTTASMRVSRVRSIRRRAWYRFRYLKMFGNRLANVYAGLLDPDGRFWGKGTSSDPTRPITIRNRDGGERRPDLVLWCDAKHVWHESSRLGSDAWLRLTRFHGGDAGSVLVAPGFAMSARSFALQTDRGPNFAEYLVREGYDVWLFDYRASIDLPSARTDFTLDDIAQQDWRKAVAEVRARTDQRDVQVVAHCAGTTTFLMALAEGLTGVRSAVLSQFTLHPTTLGFVRFKTALRVPTVLRWLGFKTVAPDALPTLRAKAFDTIFAVWPVPRGERCGRAACRWVNLMFGMTHRHANLDDATHNEIISAFGVGDLHAMEHLGVMLTKQLVVDHEGRDRYLHAAPEFRIPMHFIVGNLNQLFLPESTGRTMRFLREVDHAGDYTSTLFETYAHLDLFIGRDAEADVFPDIVAALQRHPLIDLPKEHASDAAVAEVATRRGRAATTR